MQSTHKIKSGVLSILLVISMALTAAPAFAFPYSSPQILNGGIAPDDPYGTEVLRDMGVNTKTADNSRLWPSGLPR